jgi:hypothetical protein
MKPPPLKNPNAAFAKFLGIPVAIVIGLGILSGGGSPPSPSPSAAPAPAVDAPKTETEKPEPARPAPGQEVSEEYFKWIEGKMGFECQQQIKRLVRNDMRSPGLFSGTNSMDSVFFVLQFNRWSKRVANDGTIKMRGDQAEAQNGLGNWMRANYSCTVNIDTKTVTDASIDNGRLN